MRLGLRMIVLMTIGVLCVVALKEGDKREGW